MESIDIRNNQTAYNASNSDLVSTTISTIVVQGGPLQLVIALLQNGDYLQVKVVDITPKITMLGKNLDEALNIQKQNEELLLNIQNLPTPLEEFYHKIKEKIANNEPQNPRLIEDMADNLNKVWSDIQKVLHERRFIINLNVLFFENLGKCHGKMSSLEVACRDTMIPIEVEAVQDFLEQFKQLRLDVLASIMNPLLIGNQLLEKLDEIESVGSLDSRPNHIRNETLLSINQVKLWLEDLSDKRNSLESAWLNRKIQLEQCLALAKLSKDLSELEKILDKQRDEILSTFDLGFSKSSAISLLKDYSAWKVDATALRDKSLKITKSTEEIVRKGNFSGDQVNNKAYNVLSKCTEYYDEIEVRETLLKQAVKFFEKAELVLEDLNKLEIELGSMSLRPGSPDLIPVHLKLLQNVGAAVNEVLQIGYSIIDEVGRTKNEVNGIKVVVDEIENRKLRLETKFSSASEQHFKISSELNAFLEKYNDLFSWLEFQKREKIICGSINFMGSNIHQAKECDFNHRQLLADLEDKGKDIKNLLNEFSVVREKLDETQRTDIDEKSQVILKNWDDLRSFLEARMPLIDVYVNFHNEADNLRNLFSNLENTLKSSSHSNDYQYIDVLWNKIQNQYTQLKNIAKTFEENVAKVADPYLQTDRATNIVEKILNEFSSRQLDLSDVWESWNTRKEINIILETIMTENKETITLTTKIEHQLYPILDTVEDLPSDLIRFVDSKFKHIQNEVHEADKDLQRRIEKIDKMEAGDETTSEKIVQVKNNLNSIKTKLFTINADYSELVNKIVDFLKAYQGIYENIREYFTAKQQPINGGNVEELIKDYEQFKNQTMEQFRSLLAQSEKIIDRIKMQEPPGAKEHDTDKIITLLETLRAYFESRASSENSELKRQHFVTEFEKMLNDINGNIDSLKLQYSDIADKYADSAASAKVSSLSFEYFERNHDLLDKRIDTFASSYKNCANNYPDLESHINEEIDKLVSKWNEFKLKVADLKEKLGLAREYFQILETVENRYHQTYTFLVNSANLKKNDLKSSVSAFELIDEIEKYVIENKPKQMDDLEKLAQVSKLLFGFDKTETLLSDNMFIFQSFEKIKSDIVDIVKELKQKEDPVSLINEIDKNILVIESMEDEESKLENSHEIIPVIENEAPKFIQPLVDGEIDEGQRFKFECVVKGVPEPTVKWLKDSISIENNFDYKTNFTNGKCELEIEETLTADSAKFTCIASNVAGTTETSAYLIVKENVVDDYLIAPEFMKHLQNFTVKENSTCELNCLVTGNPLPTVQWFKDNECIDSNPEYNITYNNGNAVLKIEHVKLLNQANYMCKATNQAGVNETMATLSVEAVKPPGDPPVITKPLGNVSVFTGDLIKLECEILGDPKPNLFLVLDGRVLSDDDYNLQYDFGKVTIYLSEKNILKNIGSYEIKLLAKNNLGEALTSCNILLESPPNVMETVQPSIQLPLKNTSIFEGKSARLDCVIVGVPEPEVIWYHNEKPVKESQDIQLLFQGDHCSLIIREAFVEDAGNYKIVAINSAGEASSQCSLTVIPLNIPEPESKTPVEFVSEVPPKFQKLLTDILAVEGETVEFECSLLEGTEQTVKWYLNNHEINYSDRVQSVKLNDGTLKLIIKDVKPDDKGVYTVKASNSVGDAKCFSHLIVKCIANGVEKQPVAAEIEEKQVCPNFTELFSDKSVPFDDDVKFECIVNGKPTPKIKWYFNDMPVQGHDFLVSTSGERQVMAIQKVNPTKIGKISCVAENEAGKAMCVAFLTLSSHDIPPSEGQFSIQEDTTGSSFVTIQKQVTTTTTMKHAENGFQKVEMESHPPSSIQNLIQNERHEEIISKSGQISQGKPIRRNVAPRFVSPLIGKIVDQGVDVVLEGIVDGYPTPKVEVIKNGEELKNVDGKVKVTYNLNKVIVELFNVNTKDAGRYSCVATNDAGSATSTADLIVKKSIFPPVFGKRLQAQVVKKGERVSMDVEITGTPEPKVQWFKDQQPLAEVMTSPYKLQQFGNCYKLTIENVNLTDTGKYMVTANNAGGEAQSIADFLVVEAQPERMMEVTKTVVFNDVPGDNFIQTEPLKADIPNEQTSKNYETHQESTTQAHMGSSTEQTVVTETKRTTEATIRMEHKQNFMDLGPVTFSQRTQTPTIPLVSEGTMVDSDLNLDKKFASETKETTTVDSKFINPETQEPLNFQPIRKHAFEFFENNIKNIPTLSEDKYTRYEDAIKSKSFPKASDEDNNAYRSKINEDLQNLNIMPGPEPEMGFMPKPSAFATEKISDKVKKLEYIHSQSTQPPVTGSVSVFPRQSPMKVVPPPPFVKSEEKFEEMKSFSRTVESSNYEFPPTSVSAPPKSPVSNNLLFSEPTVARASSPKPSSEALAMEKLWAPKSPVPFSKPQFSHEQTSSFVAYTSQTQRSFPIQEQFVPIETSAPVQPVEQFTPMPPATVQFVPKPIEPVQPKPTFIPMPPVSVQPLPTQFTPMQFTPAPPPVVQSVPVQLEDGEQFPTPKQSKKIFEEKIKQEEKSVTELKAPAMVREVLRPQTLPKPQPLQNIVNDLGLEPGTPPEICYAPKPVLERKESYVEKIEKTLEKNLDREPEKVPRGGVRILPAQRTTPQRFKSESPMRFTGPSPIPPVKKEVFVNDVVDSRFESRTEFSSMQESSYSMSYSEPVLELQQPVYAFAPQEVIPPAVAAPVSLPEPVQATVPEPVKTVPVFEKQPTPIPAEPIFKETVIQSQAALSGFRHVEPPKLMMRPRSVEPTPLPPTQFEKPKESNLFTTSVPVTKAPEPIQVKREPTPKKFEPPRKAQTPTPTPTFKKQEFKRQTPVKQIQPSKDGATAKAKQMFESMSETTESAFNAYKNFVRSEQNTFTTESYFRQNDLAPVEAPKIQNEPKPKPTMPAPQMPQPQDAQKDYNMTSMMKNISMTTKQIKVQEETNKVPSFVTSTPRAPSLPAKSPVQQRPVDLMSESFEKYNFEKFDSSSSHMQSSVQESYHTSSQPIFSPNFQQMRVEKPKFQPIEKPSFNQQFASKTSTVEKKQHVYKPTPLTPAQTQPQESKETYYHYAPQTTTFYTAVTAPPVHNALATETSSTMHMKESTEKSHRVVNISTTKRVIAFDDSKKLEPFPFTPNRDDSYRKSVRVPPPPTPTKFVPGEFKESDYDSEIESTRIRPVWTPNPSDSDEPHYRRVRPPSQQSRSSSLPRSYERVLTPMEFDTHPVQMPTKIKIQSPSLKTPQQYFNSPLYRDQSTKTQTLDRHVTKKTTTTQPYRTTDDISIRNTGTTVVESATSQMKSINKSMQSKAHQFMDDLMRDVKQPKKPALNKAVSVNEPQAYRNETRVSQYGTKHVDPDTGIIYFKYDFGYEFGIIFPGEGKKIVGGLRNQSTNQSSTTPKLSDRTGDIELPVYHERTTNSTPTFDNTKKRYSLPISGQLGRITPKFNAHEHLTTKEYSSNTLNRSGTPGEIVNQYQRSQPKNPPIFITPLKDIAVFAGQAAKFECIVQGDPSEVYWARNSDVIQNSNKFNIEFRNGVCRLTIPQAYPNDAATYTCVASNAVGSDTTSAVLVVPGNNRGIRK